MSMEKFEDVSLDSLSHAFELLGKISKSTFGVECDHELAAILDKIQACDQAEESREPTNMDVDHDEKNSSTKHDQTLTPLSPLLAVVSSEQFNCAICASLLCRPLTIPCGHTFCRECLSKHLEASDKFCPACRATCLIDPQAQPENFSLRDFLDCSFPSLYRTRLVEVDKEAELARRQKRTPLFVVSHFFAPLTLMQFRFFEPKYLAMTHRLLHTNQKKFGFICRDDSTHVVNGDFGLDVHILECSVLRDGTVFMTVVFGHRFTVNNPEQDPLGLWSCERVDYADDTLGIEEFTPQFREDFAAVLAAVRRKKVRIDNTVFPRPNPMQEPPCPDWLLAERGNIPDRDPKEMTHEVYRWSMYSIAILFSNELSTPDDTLRQLITTKDCKGRYRTLRELYAPVRKRSNGPFQRLFNKVRS